MSISASLYYHGVLSPEGTEALLTEDNSYLVRRSPLNAEYILSYLTKNQVKHEIIESGKSTRKNVSFEDVAGVVQEMVTSSQYCVHAVFPPPPPSPGFEDSREEILARKMKLPFKVSDIINSTVDSFNKLLTRPRLSPMHIKVCRDIRRRGKNKKIRKPLVVNAKGVMAAGQEEII